MDVPQQAAEVTLPRRTPAPFPRPGASGREAPHNLPAPVTSFVGRGQELRAIVRLLGRAPPAARLVTLTGTGGVGKTRLALEAAAALRCSGPYPDGVWHVELAPLGEPRRLAQLVAGVFGLQEEPRRQLREVLIDALRPRRLLLLLDNCEHLVAACAELADALLRACPRIGILATSREPLRIYGETVLRVPALDRPDPRSRPSLDQLGQFEAVRLFVDRAAAAAVDFSLTGQNAPAVARVCDRLDGIPLALELAAARVRALSVEQIAARLDDRFRLLGVGSRTAPPRQRTLEAAVAWSYDLLGDDERRLFNRLAVFAGGWTLGAAEAICAGGAGTSVLDVLARLVEKSLLLAEDGPDGGKRYRLLETLRQFAAERLRASGEEGPVRDRHLQWYVAFAVEAERSLRWTPGLTWQARMQWLARVEGEYANLRAAWQWALRGGAGRVQAGLRLAVGLFPFFYVTGYLAEGRDWLAALLEQDAGHPPSAARAWGLATAAKLAAHHGDDTTAQQLGEEYLALPETHWTAPASALAHTALGVVALRRGDAAGARAHATEALELSRASGELVASMYPPYLAAAAAAEGRLDEAQALYEQALEEGRGADFQLSVGLALHGLGRLAHARGDRRGAGALYEQALGTLGAIGGMPQTALVLVSLGHLALQDGDLARARARFEQGLDLAARLGHRQVLTAALEGAAVFLTAAGGPSHREGAARALRLLGAAGRLQEGISARPPEASALDARSRAEAVVGRGAAEALRSEGRAWALEEATEKARAALAEASAGGVATGSGAVTSPLTRREREVAAYLARGRTNRQIAEALVISERTTEMHVSNLLAKLGLTSRAQAAVWAAARGLGAQEPGTPAPAAPLQ
jgi:non-specific serine/threonine protein kinase